MNFCPALSCLGKNCPFVRCIHTIDTSFPLSPWSHLSDGICCHGITMTVLHSNLTLHHGAYLIHLTLPPHGGAVLSHISKRGRVNQIQRWTQSRYFYDSTVLLFLLHS